ncbi:MAG: sulfatase-like hydrolase/transferase [Verrucomicrobiaceae bacterium]
MIRFLLILLLPTLALAADKPNILWIVSEDNASHWLGCYGNDEAQTPNLDALAARSTRFTHAYSNAPVCAVARATILMGISSPTMGTQHMRSRHPIPSHLTPYVTHLRKAGYYTSNASKTDYNFEGNDKKLWDDCSPKAHYNKRPEGKPFFSIFNLTISHESNLFPGKIAANRKKGLIPQTPRLDPATLKLPPYLPDLPEMRHDFAVYHDTMTALDTQIGDILAKLKKDGLADNTIIFYYGDHGGPTPRGKRYLHDTGVRIPMIIHVPEKWKHLSTFQNGTVSNEIVSFVDLAPTLLSLVGLKDDPNMQGRPFLGPNREEPAKEPYAFLFADRFDEIYGLRRGIATDRYKYVRHFTPHTWAAPYSFYQFQMASWPAWRNAWKEGKLTGVHASLWENNQPSEELYDTQADPWEINNLAADPAHAGRLASLRDKLLGHMLTIRDTGLIPEPLFDEVRGDKTIMETAAAASEEDCRNLLNLAFIASSGDPDGQPALEQAATHKSPLARFWAYSGLVTLGQKAASSEKVIVAGLKDPVPLIRAQAAIALHNIGHKQSAVQALITGLDAGLSVTNEAMIINTLMQIRETKAIPKTWFDKHLKEKSSTNELRMGTLAENVSMFND